jgi:hypothetical protein
MITSATTSTTGVPSCRPASDRRPQQCRGGRPGRRAFLMILDAAAAMHSKLVKEPSGREPFAVGYDFDGDDWPGGVEARHHRPAGPLGHPGRRGRLSGRGRHPLRPKRAPRRSVAGPAGAVRAGQCVRPCRTRPVRHSALWSGQLDRAVSAARRGGQRRRLREHSQPGTGKTGRDAAPQGRRADMPAGEAGPPNADRRRTARPGLRRCRGSHPESCAAAPATAESRDAPAPQREVLRCSAGIYSPAADDLFYCSVMNSFTETGIGACKLAHL